MPDIYEDNRRCIAEAVSSIAQVRSSSKRLLVAIAGPPGVGKSTIADGLVSALNDGVAGSAALLPMDGFHLDNAVLSEAYLLDRKGSPDTFDFHGFESLVKRIKDNSIDHYVPIFDRSREIAIAGARKIAKQTPTIVVEGNYLLLNQAPWVTLKNYFDFTVFVTAPMPVLRTRLIKRWLEKGYDAQGARQRAEHNDIPNAALVTSQVSEADILFEQNAES